MTRFSAKPIALGGVLAALALVIMCFVGIIPLATYICPMLSIMICAVVLRYCGRRIAWAWYAAVAILCLLMGPDLEAKALFLVLGYYPIIKPFFDKARPSWLWKHAYFNIVIVATYSALFYTMGIDEVLADYKELGVIGFGLLLVAINVLFYMVDLALERRFMKK